MIRLTLSLAVLLATATANVLSAAEPTAQQPNIIYINTDDWGIGKVPSLKMDPASERIIKTPNLDQLAADGMTFVNAYCGNAVCGPSRCTLLTGKHPGHAAWRSNRGKMPAEVWPVQYPLLGQVARDAGYTTAGFGKLSTGGSNTPEEITQCGWDYWLGFLGHIDCRDYYARKIWENGKQIDLPRNTPDVLKGTVLAEGGSGVVGEGKGTFIEDLYTDKLIEFITTNKDQPFFVYLASTVPHGGPPGGMRVPSLEGYDQVEVLTKYEQVYCALMTRHDRNVGRIRKALDELGLTENTIVIWTSDNGDEDSYYKRTGTFDGNGPYRMMKRYLYEGGIRAPMFAAWPGTIPPGSTSELITTQVDLMPTLADAGRQPVTEEMDGISILPTLAGKPEDQTAREYIYFEYYQNGKQQSVRMKDWKAYRNGGWKADMELYDLAKDPGEQNNLAAEHPELIEKMKAIMRKEHGQHPIYKL